MAVTKRTARQSTGGTAPSRVYLPTTTVSMGSPVVGGVKHMDWELERDIKKNEEDVENELFGLANVETQRRVVQAELEAAEWCELLKAIPIKTKKNMLEITEDRLRQVLLKRQKTS